MPNTAQAQKIRTGQGFIAALDQSGGSTPKALRLYGIADDAYATDADMFDMIHTMRSRIVQAPAFTGDRVIGAILFENTMDRTIAGKPVAQYLWTDRGVVPFLKIDQGLATAANGVKLMRPIAGLDPLLTRAAAAGIFGTKARSVIDAANPDGIAAIVAQQFDVAAQVLANNMVPIIEPEVMLRAEITRRLDALPHGAQVMLKLTLPTQSGLYAPLITHPNVMRVVALSGGYTRAEACEKLSHNPGMIASFSRALTEGLRVDQAADDFNATLGATIAQIYAASAA